MITALFATALLAVVPPGSQPGLPPGEKPTGQVAREGSFDLDMGADKAMYFFTPEGERAWVAFQTNAVFRVDEGIERSLWTIAEADLQGHIAEYVYVVEGERLSRVRVEIQPLASNRCRVKVQYVHTATSGKGMQFVTGLSEEAFAQKMRDWQRMVSAAIR